MSLTLLVVGQSDTQKVRFDQFLTESLKENVELHQAGVMISRELAKDIIQRELATLNGKQSKPSAKVDSGDEISFDTSHILQLLHDNDVEREHRELIRPIEGDIEIIDEDKKYLILNKQRGLAVHPATGHEDDNLANRVAFYLQTKGVDTSNLYRSGLVHRLDKSVGGIIIFAKERAFQERLLTQFREHSVLKIYRADSSSAESVIGERFSSPLAEQRRELLMLKDAWLGGKEEEVYGNWLEVNGFIRRDTLHRKRMLFQKSNLADLSTNVSPNSRYSKTLVRRYGENCMLIRILTGRTHQIRATLGYLGAPVNGDTLYSSQYKIPEQIELWSVTLGVESDGGERRVWQIEI